MSNQGLLFDVKDPFSPSRLNSKTYFWGTGPQILAIPSSSDVRIAICTETGSGFLINEAYMRSADKNSWIPLRMSQHLHNAADDASGGKLSRIWAANQALVQFFKIAPKVENMRGFNKIANSPLPVTRNVNNTFYHDISTGNEVNDYSNAYDSDGLKADLAQPIDFSVKYQVSHYQDIVWRIGMNQENAQSAITYANKFWIEACDAHGNFITGGVSNGLGATVQVSTTPAVPTPNVSKSTRMKYTPALNVLITNSDGGFVNLGTNVPSSGQVPSDRLFAAGIQTKSITQKSLFIWLAEITYEVNDVWI